MKRSMKIRQPLTEKKKYHFDPWTCELFIVVVINVKATAISHKSTFQRSDFQELQHEYFFLLVFFDNNTTKYKCICLNDYYFAIFRFQWALQEKKHSKLTFLFLVLFQNLNMLTNIIVYFQMML